MQKEIFYSIRSNGDGSASTVFCESELVADIHQEIMVNGEECTGKLTVESDSPITVVDDILTAKNLIDESDIFNAIDRLKQESN